MLNSELEQSYIIKIQKVSKSDIRFLFNLLKERDKKANISHKSLPTYPQHVHFFLSKPYKAWYIIKWKNKKAGSIYLSKQDEIGIFLRKKFRNLGLGNKALKILIKKHPRPRYLANISPKNLKSINFFKKNGFNLIQYTYEMTPLGNDSINNETKN